MLIALLADIHGNREALTACLAEAERAGPSAMCFSGDLVGYGADPAWVVDRVAEMVERRRSPSRQSRRGGARSPSETMNPPPQRRSHGRARGSTPAHTFVSRPASIDRRGGRPALCACERQRAGHWIYVLGPREAFQSFRATPHRLTFCGHTHYSGALQRERYDRSRSIMFPADGKPIPLLGQRRWLAVLGAVGQPRDNNPAACYGLFDDRHATG